MASRLDKLFELLESNNQSIRSAAAIQIGKISTNSQVQIQSLLKKLLLYVKHKQWSVRISAAEALKYIGLNSKLWVPNVSNSIHGSNIENFPDMISLDNLNLLEILKIGTRLYSTDVKDLDESNAFAPICENEISQHLGFTIPDQFEIKSILKKEDYEIYTSKDDDSKVSVEKAVEKLLGNGNKKRSHDECTDVNEPNVKMSCVLKQEIIDNEESQDSSACLSEWPWTDFCNALLTSLWNPKWEVRHGAATALREVIRSQGSVMICKIRSNISRSDFTDLHVRFQEDIVCRLLCTLALDQLSDFISDEMVAPVRESCAQVLGVISLHLPESLVISLARNLLSLLNYSEWTVNHGALLGLKYLLAARLDMSETLLPLLYEPISNHLKDNCDEDVRCAAVAALMPIFNKNGSIVLQVEQLDLLRHDLWNVLALRPDYTSPGATCAVLHLLEKLYQYNQSSEGAAHFNEKQFNASINRLHWCYYSYSDSVRLAAVRTCGALVRFYGSQLHQLNASTLLQIMTQLFQRVLVDESLNVLSETENLWSMILSNCSCDILAQSCLERLDVWMCCAMQPARLSYALGIIVMPQIETVNEDCKYQFPKEFFIGGRESFLTEGGSTAREDAVLRARLISCRLLASLCSKLCNIAPLAEHILITIIAQIHLKERLAIQRFVAATILAHWNLDFEWVSKEHELLTPLRLQLLAAIEEPIYYQELLPVFRQMIKSSRDLIACYQEHNINISVNQSANSTNLNLAQCQSLVTPELYASLNGSADTTFSAAKTSIDLCSEQHLNLTRLVEISLGRALLHWGWLPNMLTPLIKPLMDAIRCEARLSVQTEAAIALGQLVVDFAPKLANPIGKLVRNLVQYLSDSIDCISPNSSISNSDIVALHKIIQLGREAYPCQEEVPNIDGSLTAAFLKLRGSRLALEKICCRLIEIHDTYDLSVLIQVIYHQPIKLFSSGEPLNQKIMLPALRAMVKCLPHLISRSNQLSISLCSYAQHVFQHGLCHSDSMIRHWSARVLAILIMPCQEYKESQLALFRDLIDSILLNRVLHALDSMTNDNSCLGSIELLYLVMHKGILKYRLALVAIVIPTVLRSLNSPLDSVRRIATHMFSLLLSLLALEQSGADTSILTESRKQDRKSSIQFIEGLLNPDLIPEFNEHKSHITASLRHYQAQGVNWLSFLSRYGLHGVLADDMGLGKTLQTISIIVGKYSQDPKNCAPSLVVCPPTLTSHWQQEITKHVSIAGFTSIVYTGSVDVRQTLNLSRHQIVITSYDILRNDIDRLSRPPVSNYDGEDFAAWNYVVLDEGHLIRNHKSKIAIATKSVYAKHRLVLTGTPIQNRVAELWSLFDFLMPGLLGTHLEFHRRYGRLLEQSGSSSGKKVDSEAGTLALEQLHQQVLPFMLRRVKEDVLHELPPKIMQDYICTMTPLQARLYSYCVESHQSASTDDMLNIESASLDQRKHVFQAMHYLRLVCNHPCLALCDSHPLYQSIKKEFAASNQSLEDIGFSGKLVALKQLILDCGIGSDDLSSATGPYELVCSSGVVSSHRLLIFCQSRAMIKLVERMLCTEIPKASHLRLDGSVSIKDRQNIVDRFNHDASIDLLLLTTSIGGLGLNLTSADIVIFVEHDWNPMRDLQAMDRAHRIGQKNTVNVYRLITADSIEEKIMNLQKFKMFVANTVVSSDNKQMLSMNTEGLLDILNKESETAKTNTKTHFKSGLKSMLSRLEGVYDSLDEYDEEYNLESFVKKL